MALTETAMAGNNPVNLDRQHRSRMGMRFYTNGIALLGILVVLLALANQHQDRLGLLLFAALAAGAELTNVELFSNSRSRISISSIIAIAGFLQFGPLAGALIHAASGVTTLATTSLGRQRSEPGRASPWQRTAFNAGMLVISTAIAGWAYVRLGGTVGDIRSLSNFLPLLAAASLDTIVNLALLSGVISLQTSQPLLNIWRRDYQWSAPIAIVSGALGGAILALAFEMFHFLGLAVFLLPILATSYSFRLYVRNMRGYVDQMEETNQKLEALNENQDKLINDLLEMLSQLIDMNDRYTGKHSSQVTVYALAIAERMGLPEAEKDRLYKAAKVHDIGKLGVMDSVIGKAGRLTDEEYNRVKKHPVYSANYIGSIQGLQSLVPLVRHHHERWDGKGYPDGLKGEEIPLAARILTLADAVDAMLSDRPYRPVNPSLNMMIEEVRRCSGTQFDPEVVKAFFQVVEEKDRSFFKNSAALLDRELLLSGIDAGTTESRYLKKSQME